MRIECHDPVRRIVVDRVEVQHDLKAAQVQVFQNDGLRDYRQRLFRKIDPNVAELLVQS
jgi:hypothetical protein